MLIITQTMGWLQLLLDIPFDIQRYFEEYLPEEQKTFMAMLIADFRPNSINQHCPK